MHWTVEDYDAVARKMIELGTSSFPVDPKNIQLAAAQVSPNLIDAVSKGVSRSRVYAVCNAIKLAQGSSQRTRMLSQAEGVVAESLHRRKELADLMFKQLLAEQTNDIISRMGQAHQELMAEIHSLRARVEGLEKCLGEHLGVVPKTPEAIPEVVQAPAPTRVNSFLKIKVHVFHLESRSYRELQEYLKKEKLEDYVDLSYTPTTGGIPSGSRDKYDKVYFSTRFVQGNLGVRLKKAMDNVVPVDGGNTLLHQIVAKDILDYRIKSEQMAQTIRKAMV